MFTILIQGIQVWYPGLFLLGLCAGFLSGFFGVGGGFIVTPLLNIIFGIPYNIAVGSSLGQMAGTSASASISHGKLGNIDYKLGLIIILSSITGVEIGANIIQSLKHLGIIVIAGHKINATDFFVSISYLILLTTIAIITFCESRTACKRPPRGGIVDNPLIHKIKAISIPPVISLKKSGIDKISLWIIIGLGFSIGILSGLMGVGGGFVGTPALIYAIGIPTKIAIGTELFSITFSSGFGCFTHALKENVNFLLVLLLLTGSVIGARLGVAVMNKLRAARVRFFYSILMFIVASMVFIKLLTKFC